MTGLTGSIRARTLTRRTASTGCALALGATLAALAFALARTFTGGGSLGNRLPLHGWYAADGLLFALALLLARGAPERVTRVLVPVGGAVVAATGLLAGPRTSDDVYRYVWDGRVQAAGISPYARVPADPALTSLRDAALFPRGAGAGAGGCHGWDLHQLPGGLCTHINRPTVHTIYPPVAEAWFLLAHALGGTVRTVQLLGLLLALAVTAVLLRMLTRRGRPARWAGIWAWCPGVAIWSVNDAHIDTLGVLLTLLGLGLATAGPSGRGAGGCRPWAAGLLLGAAAAVKLVPALALPGALSVKGGRRPWRTALAAVAAFVLSYLPYLLLSGVGVIGYLPGYLHEEGYDQGRRFGLLALLPLPQARLGVLAAALLLAVAVGVVLRGDPARPWAGARLVVGSALLLATPQYPWYSLLLIPLAALEGRWEWLGVPAAGAAEYLLGGPAQQPAYLAALGLLLAATLARGRIGTRFSRAARPGPPPSRSAATAAGTGSSRSGRGSTRAG